MNQERKGKHKKLTAGALIIAGVILLVAVGIRCDIKNRDEQDRRAYQGGWAGRWKVGADLSKISLDAVIKCQRMGLHRDECPESDGDTLRRVMATLMTQTIERNSVAWRGMAYVPETIRAMNHQFYDLILWLEENQCAAGTGTKDTSGVLALPGPTIYSPTFQENKRKETHPTYIM